MVQADVRASAGERLYSLAWGPGDTTPIVLLHGLGADHLTFVDIKAALSAKRRVIVFDLPGHGKSVEWPDAGNAAVAAKAVLQSLQGLEVSNFHIVGHSMGGAIAAVVGLMNAKDVRSMTLLAPGGFGRSIDIRLMRRYATETCADRLEIVLESMFGYEQDIPDRLPRIIEGVRRDKRIRCALSAILAAITDGREQRTLPVAKLASLKFPKTIVWGTQDRLLPPDHINGLEGDFDIRLLPGVGHMVHLESPHRITRIIQETVKRGETATS